MTCNFFNKLAHVVGVVGFALFIFSPASVVAAQSKKPNILVIWGDDIGLTNISA